MRISNFILILFVLGIVHLSEQASLKSLNRFQECLCDVTDLCDAQCCCDKICDQTLLKHWKTYGLCTDDNFRIPFCYKLGQTDVNVVDLNSGLRTIYSVIKRLFCIDSVNFVQPSSWFTKTIAQQDLETQYSKIQESRSQSTVNKDFESLQQFNILGLPLRSANGLCRSSSTLPANLQKTSSCRVYLPSANNISASFLSVNQLQASLNVTLHKYSTKTVSTGGILVSLVNISTTCSSNQCQNVIRQIKILINSQNGTINSNSYVIVGPMTIYGTAYVNVDYQYTFVTTSNGQVNLPYSANKGYQLGSKLNLLFKDSNSQYYKIMNPVNIAFRKLDGSCRTSSSDQAANSLIQLNFGQNLVVSCYGTSNLISQNINTIFNYVGKYGISSTKLSEFLNVTKPSSTISKSQSLQILIYYINIGVPYNPQYQISKVQFNAVTSKDGLSSLYVEYVSLGNSLSLYVPLAPTIQAYLPNDFLYPFYVA